MMKMKHLPFLKLSKFLILVFPLTVNAINKRQPISANRFEQLSGIRNDKDQKSFWDKRYSKEKYIYGKSPAKFLSQNYGYIPKGSRILDIGMGEGRNAVFLATKGYEVLGVDISSVAIKKAKRLANEFGVRIETKLAAMEKYKVPEGAFDAIICFYYIDRALNDKLVSWLKPGGVLIYEAHTDNQLKKEDGGKYEKKYLLRPGELLSMFPTLKILKYEEPLHYKDYTASIILQKI